MTADEVEQWKHERDIARSISDPDERKAALEKVYDHRDDLQMKCIQHQADRIKTCLAKDLKMEQDIADIKEDLRPCVESDKKFRNLQERAKGARQLWDVLKVVAGAGGGYLITKLLGA